MGRMPSQIATHTIAEPTWYTRTGLGTSDVLVISRPLRATIPQSVGMCGSSLGPP